MKNCRIFITGATGFIGAHLASALAGENTVYVLARGPRTDNRDKNLLAQGIKIIRGDLLSPEAYAPVLKDTDYVFHLAALFQVDASKRELFKANVEGTDALLSACEGAGIKKFIFFSTAYVNAGRRERDDITEDEPYAVGPRNWYEWSKAEAEKVVMQKSRELNIPFVILRPVIVYGEGITNSNSILTGYKLCQHKRLVLVRGGRNKLHFVAVEDVVKAAIQVAAGSEQNKIFNVCDEQPYSQAEIIKLILAALHSSYKPPTVPKFLLKTFIKFFPAKRFFYGFNKELADFFCDNHTFSNQKLKATGYQFLYPDLTKKFSDVIEWYNHNRDGESL